MRKDLISILDLDKTDIFRIFKTAFQLKEKQKKGVRHFLLEGKTLGMIFHKPSTRTRVSFEAGMYQLGGYALFLSSSELQLRRGETIADTARTLSRYLDGIMIRTYEHQDVQELAAHSSVPVINGLTDREHPCQVLADTFTIMEKKKLALDEELSSLREMKVAYVGDGNNVAHSWIHMAARTGLTLSISSPDEYRVSQEVLKEVGEFRVSVFLTPSPREAVRGADVIYTDVWASMGKEEEKRERLKVFGAYQVNRELLSFAPKDCLVMHCLPAHRGEEITNDVMDGEWSVVFDQAENRLHVQKAIMLLLMGRDTR